MLTINVPETTTDVAVVAGKLKKLFLAGDIPPMQTYARVKAAIDVLENVLKDWEVKDAVMTEADLYKEKTFEVYGALWTKKMVGVKYDYTTSDDPVYNDLAGRLKDLQADMKRRESFLKALPPGGEVVTNQETGETSLIYPPAKSGQESISCTLK